MSSIESGRGDGYVATVESDGSLRTSVSNTVDVNVQNSVTATVPGVVATRPVPCTSVSRTLKSSVGTTSDQLVAANTSRRQIEVVNKSASITIYIRFGSSGATTDDLPIGPGGRYSFPSGITFTEAVQVIAASSSADVLAIEFE